MEPHECSYYCLEKDCILRQRDELRDELERRVTESYKRGWNTALTCAAALAGDQFRKPLGQGVVDTISAWLRNQKK
jgi:hypothetical protein